VTLRQTTPGKRPKAAPSAGLRNYQSAVAARKRSALMRGARTVFLRDGYDRATVAAIAASAGISPATLYKHFRGGKAEIFGEVVGAGAATVFPAIQDAAQRDRPVDLALRNFAEACARMLVNPQTVGFFRIVIAETPKLPEVGDQWERFGNQRLVEGLRSLLRDRTEAGDLLIDDVGAAADQLIALLLHPLLWPAFFQAERRPSDESVARAIDEALRTFLARYRAPAARRHRAQPV
jgi:AcrR family transcriptional regulator